MTWIWRLLASVAFLFGGAVTLLLVLFLNGYGASQAAMSAGPTRGGSDGDRVFLFLICSYFVISALAVAVCRHKLAMQIAAGLAHLVLGATFIGICMDRNPEEPGRALAGMFISAAIGLLYFAPWMVVWLIILARSKRIEQPGKVTA
jgi:hypothetical protein